MGMGALSHTPERSSFVKKERDAYLVPHAEICLNFANKTWFMSQIRLMPLYQICWKKVMVP